MQSREQRPKDVDLRSVHWERGVNTKMNDVIVEGLKTLREMEARGEVPDLALDEPQTRSAAEAKRLATIQEGERAMAESRADRARNERLRDAARLKEESGPEAPAPQTAGRAADPRTWRRLWQRRPR